MGPGLLLGILVMALPILLSLTLHEYAHARTALVFGDPTARDRGRCTLNPLVHLDPLGTIALFIVHFGWAKPVPVDHRNLHPRRLGSIAVSLAGPGANLLLALVAAGTMHLMVHLGVIVDTQDPQIRLIDAVAYMVFFALTINLVLMAFNLLPLFPLDGHHVTRELMSGDMQMRFMRWQMRYGNLLLLVLLLGPRVASMVMPEANIPDPLGWYLGNIVYPAAEMLLGDEGFSLAISAARKLSPHLAF